MKICKHNNCNIKANRKIGYCENHYRAFLKYGIIPDWYKLKNEPQEIIVKNDYARIIVCKSNGEPRKEIVKIDLDDINKVIKYRCGVASNYIMFSLNNRREYLHRLIMGFPKGMIDHINGDGYDNRKCNLRIVNYSQNKTNSTKHKGYSYIKSAKGFISRIRLNGKLIYLGYHKKEEDARKSYLDGRKKYFGEYAPIRK